MTEADVRASLSAYWETLPVNNTHCHHLTDDWFADASLHKLVNMSYNSWICPPFEDSEAGWDFWFDRMGVNSYAYWLTLAYGKLYGDGTRLCRENRAAIDKAVRAAYADPQHHSRMLTEVCHYDHVVLDDYMSPGSNHGLPVVRPTFRTDMFLFGFSKTGTDENHNCAWDYAEKYFHGKRNMTAPPGVLRTE